MAKEDNESSSPGTSGYISIHFHPNQRSTRPAVSYRRNLHHLELDVLGLGQGAPGLAHRDVLDPLVVPLGCTVVCGQRLRQLRHRLGQQVRRLPRENL